MAAEQHKSQARQVDAHQHQGFQQGLPVLAGNECGDEIERIAHHVIAQCGDDIAAVPDAHIPGGNGAAGQNTAGGLAEPAAIVDQGGEMLFDGVGIPDEAFSVGCKNADPDTAQHGKHRGECQPQGNPWMLLVETPGQGHDFSHSCLLSCMLRCRKRQGMRCALVQTERPAAVFSLLTPILYALPQRDASLRIMPPRTGRPVPGRHILPHGGPRPACWRDRRSQ